MAHTCILGKSVHLSTALAVPQPTQRRQRAKTLVVASLPRTACRRQSRVVPKASLTAGSWGEDKAPGLEELIQRAVEEGRNSVWWPAKKDGAAVEPPLVLAAVDQTEMDKGRAGMRDWWLKQKQQGSGSSSGSGGGDNENGKQPADQKEMDKARAEMRAWWLKQKQQGSGSSGVGGNENGKQPADQKEMDKARAEMRAWWLKQKQQGSGSSGGGDSENGRQPADQKELDKARAEMRAWWEKTKKTGYGAGSAAKPAAPAQKDNIPSKKVAVGATKAKSSGPAPVVDISKEVARASQEYRAKQERERALIQKPLDDSRAYMRKWWTQQLELKAAAYSKVWKLVPANGGEAVQITGDENTPVLFGAGPFDSNDGKTYELNLQGVSSRHARVYAKNTVTGTRNRVTGMPQYRRDYVVKDLGTTNGVFKNGSKIRPKVEVRLAPGDVIIFGDGKARFTVQRA